MRNICEEINCPFSLKNGCDRYSVSGHCHLRNTEERRAALDHNQYWLFADENDSQINIDQLKRENQSFIQSDKTSICQLRYRDLLAKED